MNRRGRIIRIIALTVFISACVTALIFGAAIVFLYKNISFEYDERLFDGARSFESTVFYADRDPYDDEYTPIAIESTGSIKKSFYALESISPYLRDGIVAVEDKRFYGHNGVDVKRTVYAALNYITRGRRSFGGSTVTQQVIKNISGDNQPSLKRKLEEIIRAIHIERRYSKEDILEVYLNVIPMGEDIYGVGAASQAYFGKEPEELSPGEAAILIGITNAPTAYNPYTHPEACKKKRDIVLSIMHSSGIISDEEYVKEVSTQIKVIDREEREDIYDSWFVETVIDDVCRDMAIKYNITPVLARLSLLRGGYKIYTTMNMEIQQTLEDYFENVSNFTKEIKDGLNYAMAITDNDNGHLVGIVGRVGEKRANRLLNHATALHIPGSTLKPIALYAPLIDEGVINWATVFDDVPESFIESSAGYREYPHNSPNVYDGLTPIKDAIARSKNTVAVKLAKILTPKRIFNSLREDFAFESIVEREGGYTDIATAPMALGQLCKGVSLRKMTEAYSALSREGEWREAVSYLKVEDHKGNVIIEKEQGKRQIFKETTARIMTRLLMTVTEEGTAKKIRLKKIVDTAGKTGTSSGGLERSFIGYTPYYTCGIWCGYDLNNKKVSGINPDVLDIWDEIMTRIHNRFGDKELKGFSTNGLYRLPYCRDSGQVYSEVCRFDPRGDRMDYGYFTADNQPRGSCERHILVRYDCVNKGVAADDCKEEDIIWVSLIAVEDRSFPTEIYVSDAEFVYRDIGGYVERPADPQLPYFQYALPEGVYVGKSRSKKQFNSSCSHR